VPSTPSKPTASDVRFAAIGAGDIEARTAALQHSLSVLEQLHGQLEFQKGGEVAQQLDRFYSIIRGKILEAQINVRLRCWNKGWDLWLICAAHGNRSSKALLQPLLSPGTIVVSSH
jgi:hypothetical protein